MAAPISSGIVATVTALDIWCATADELACRVHQQLLSGPGLPDSTLHNHLLIAGYFWVCNLPNEDLVRNELKNFAGSMLSVQGTLVDIVERVSPDGVKDRRLSMVGASAGVSLHHQSLSPLLDSLVNETRHVVSGQGFLMRLLGAIKTEASAQVDPVLMQCLRASAYQQYEYSVLAVMVLSGIEQTVRAFAQRVGLFDGQKRFTPARLAAIVTALGNSTAVEDAIKRIYDNELGNLRNRILHGAQLQIARSQQQSTISIVNPVRYPKAPDAVGGTTVGRSIQIPGGWSAIRELAGRSRTSWVAHQTGRTVLKCGARVFEGRVRRTGCGWAQDRLSQRGHADGISRLVVRIGMSAKACRFGYGTKAKKVGEVSAMVSFRQGCVS